MKVCPGHRDQFSSSGIETHDLIKYSIRDRITSCSRIVLPLISSLCTSPVLTLTPIHGKEVAKRLSMGRVGFEKPIFLMNCDIPRDHSQYFCGFPMYCLALVSWFCFQRRPGIRPCHQSVALLIHFPPKQTSVICKAPKLLAPFEISSAC